MASSSEWDPLKYEDLDESWLEIERKRQIKNIVKSYSGWFDPFSELIQNALDALDARIKSSEDDYKAKLYITIDLGDNHFTVTDNGIGLEEVNFKSCLRPNTSFKPETQTRGNKGVGATFLAYGYNYLQIGTKKGNLTLIGDIQDGRRWIEDKGGIVSSPKVKLVEEPIDEKFNEIDQGATFTLKLVGDKIRPKNLSWIGANTADKWASLLRVNTPLGGIYIKKETLKLECLIKVIDIGGNITTIELDECDYLFPHYIIDNSYQVDEILAEREKIFNKGKDTSQLPKKYTKLEGIYGFWDYNELLSTTGQKTLFFRQARLSDEYKELIRTHKVSVYGFFSYSTKLWDYINDTALGLRQNLRILKGGLQQATNHMIQGELLVIPLTRNIGYQQTTHVIVHYEDADPDLGRKGFQPEIRELSEQLSTIIVRSLIIWRELLKSDTGSTTLIKQDIERDSWIEAQKKRELENPLEINRDDLFLPLRKISITSEPVYEQDVVALFNQLLAGGVIRGITIMATDQHKRYDGIIKIRIEEPLENHYYHSESNPLGIPESAVDEPLTSPPYILEYKYNLDALFYDFSTDSKNPKDIYLAVAWEMGEDWKKEYEIVPLLHLDYLNHRLIHGVTHELVKGEIKIQLIILKELVQYLNDPDGVQDYQQETYIDYE